MTTRLVQVAILCIAGAGRFPQLAVGVETDR